MKKTVSCKQIFSALLCFILIAGIFPTSVFAAKENFTTCGHIGIRNCTPPAAGEHPDFDVTPYTPGQYEILSVNWYKGTNVSASPALNASDTFDENTVYTAVFEVQAKSAYTFTRDKNGYTTVTADVGEGAAQGEYSASVYNVSGKDNTKHLSVYCTFPATGRDVTLINTVAVTDIIEPCAGDKPSYASTITSVPTPYGDATLVQNLYWYDSGTIMTGNATFVEGKTYTVQLILIPRMGYEFAVDPNHILASAGKPFTAVTATVNGKTATVMPDYTRGTAASHIAVSAQFVCKASRQITHVDISGVTEPKTGAEPKYFIACGDSSYERHSLSNVYYAYGVAWLDGKDNWVTRNKDLFLPSTAYTVSVTLKPTGDYIFAADEYGRPLVTATVNGKEATVRKSSIEEGCIEVTYKFRKTDSLEVSKVEVNDLEVPKSGNLPDYSVTYGDTTYAAQNYSDEFTVNGVLWYNDTTRKDMRPGIDKFEGGNTYCVYIFISTTGMHTFKYVEDTDSWTASAKLNGKSAGTEEVYESTLTVWYQFTLPEDVHVCSLKEVAEVKASCTAGGKKAYYVCSECDTYYEDAKGKKVIPDISTWGITDQLSHTGGKATCKEQAKCTLCGSSYGALAAHSYGSGWGYKDAIGHAHICKTCGAPDTLQPHSGEAAACGKIAKCVECKAEYGEVMQHQWSADWAHTDRKGHAHVCTVCGERDTVVKHTPGPAATESAAQICTACKYVIEPAKNHKHELTKIAAVKATCVKAGQEQHYLCEGCGKLFSDAKGSEEIADAATLVIPAKGHKESGWKSDADAHWKVCTVKGCGAVIGDAKDAHDFNQKNKCTVCGYRIDEETTDDTPVSDTADNTEAQSGTDTEDTKPDTKEPSEETGGNTVLWIVLIACAAAACIAAAAVILVRKNKKNK